MELYSSNKDYKLYHGNMLDMLEVIEPNTIDSVITDPPYELNFMNKGWDNSGIAFQKETWQKCYEVLKPGGYLLAFGGSRTFHRIVCAIEDAGFEIRDTIMWLYGSGFPKSHNIGLDIDKLNGCGDRGHRIAVANRYHPDGTLEPNGEKLEPYKTKTEEAHKWEGWGTALKPSYEPIIVARKPLENTVAKNCLKWGVGGINIDECRVEAIDKEDLQKNWINRKAPAGFNGDKSGIYGSGKTDNTIEYTPNGRFPANTILTYDDNDFDEVCGGFPDTKSQVRISEDKDVKQNTWSLGRTGITPRGHNDSGSASRYFYCAKASKKDRDEGLDNLESKPMYQADNEHGNLGAMYIKKAGGNIGDTQLRKNTHPTVKPTELMQYLIRLVSPNGATILDPFNGSGSTGKAVMYENKERNKNYKYIGIELTEEYLPISKARIECLVDSSIEIKQETSQDIPEGQTSIFDFIGESND